MLCHVTPPFPVLPDVASALMLTLWFPPYYAKFWDLNVGPLLCMFLANKFTWCVAVSASHCVSISHLAAPEAACSLSLVTIVACCGFVSGEPSWVLANPVLCFYWILPYDYWFCMIWCFETIVWPPNQFVVVWPPNQFVLMWPPNQFFVVWPPNQFVLMWPPNQFVLVWPPNQFVLQLDSFYWSYNRDIHTEGPGLW